MVGQCKICVQQNKEVTYYSSGSHSLSDLPRHVERIHEEEWAEYLSTCEKDKSTPALKQTTLSFQNPTKCVSRQRQTEIENAVTAMIIVDTMPVTSVRKPGLRNLLKVVAIVDYH